jgi:polysaccharide export outer membrane protein
VIVRKSIVSIAVVVVGLLRGTDPAAQQPVTAQVREDEAGKRESSLRATYRLGPDDQIMIQVADVPDISSKPQRLDPNGDLKLPMVGRVHAAGMTLEQLETELTTRLKVYIHEPDVAVSVMEFHSQPVSVIGAVGTSGVRQLEGRKTLIEMLSLAGGVTTEAGPMVRITRRLDEGRIPLPDATVDASGMFSSAEIDLKSLLEARSPEKDIVIRPHDVISVPRAEMVFVVGEVGRPGPIPISGGSSVSVMEAVSASGGVSRTAASDNARILRRVAGDQKRTEVAIDLRQIMAGKANDLPLMAGDILVVPDSRGKRATARALEAAVQAGVMIGTYGLIR